MISAQWNSGGGLRNFGADASAIVLENILSKELCNSTHLHEILHGLRAGRYSQFPMALTVSYSSPCTCLEATMLKPEARSFELATAIVDAICYLQYDVPRTQSQSAGKIRRPRKTRRKAKEENFAGCMSRFIKELNKECNGRHLLMTRAA